MHFLKSIESIRSSVCLVRTKPKEFRKQKNKMLAVPGGLEAVARDRQVRLRSVHTDLQLDLPPSIPLPDGEEIPYGSSNRLHIRDSQQESEIYQKCVRAPPNRTVFEGESPPPYRSPPHPPPPPEWSGHVRCHSLSSRFCVSEASEGSLSSETGSVRSRSEISVANAQKSITTSSSALSSTQQISTQNSVTGNTPTDNGPMANAQPSIPVASEHSTQD